MERTCTFVGIPVGDITWEGLLSGSLAIPGAFAAAWFAFWLQARHAKAQSLIEEVEALREMITDLAFGPLKPGWTADTPPRFTEADVRLFVGLSERTARIRARCGWRDKALRRELGELHREALAAIISRDNLAATAATKFLEAWLDNRGAVRGGEITMASVRERLETERLGGTPTNSS